MEKNDILLILRNTAEKLSLLGITTEIKLKTITNKRWRRQITEYYLQLFDRHQVYYLSYSEDKTFLLTNNKQVIITEFHCTNTINSLGLEILQIINQGKQNRD